MEAGWNVMAGKGETNKTLLSWLLKAHFIASTLPLIAGDTVWKGTCD